MENTSYQELLESATPLSRSDQLRLLEDLRSLVERQDSKVDARSTLELQGLGKHVWASVEAQRYVDLERDSWAG